MTSSTELMNLITLILQWVASVGSSILGESNFRVKAARRHGSSKKGVEGLSYRDYNATLAVQLGQAGGGGLVPNKNEAKEFALSIIDDNKRTVSVTPSGDAVVIRNAEKSYKSGVPVLNGLNMTVPCGSIYGLLGSSGCGKTTALSCIVGLQKLDKGNIWIFGEKPGSSSIGVPGRNVGYMPQDISLYGEFTIKETLTYFGTVNGMSRDGVKRARKFLLELLSLPKGPVRIESLSGGQQRRVSLIVALLSKPELLILDEPTVGVDPLIRQNVWLHLKKLVQRQRTTVIITTHYIEECRGADNVGFLRNGRLLEEGQTERLMVEHGTNNLEKIILDLSRREDRFRYIRKSSFGNDPEVKPPSNMAKLLRKQNPVVKDSFIRIGALIGKNFAVMLRNPLLLAFNILCAACVGGLGLVSQGQEPHDLNIGLVNGEIFSCANVTPTYGGCSMDLLSCRYLGYLKKEMLILEPHASESTAIAAVQAGTSWGYITFPSNFSEALFERVESWQNPDESIRNATQFNVRLDASNSIISSTIQYSLLFAFEKFATELLDDCGYDKRHLEFPMKYGQPIFGDEKSTFREFIGPGTGVVLLTFFPVVITGIRFIREKGSGILHRSIVSGVAMWEIMIAYSISEFSILLLQSLAAYVTMTQIFQIGIKGSDTLAYVLSVLCGYAGVSLGFLLGVVCTGELQAAMITMACFFPNMFLSGVLWPLEGMYPLMAKVVQALPCTLASEAARSITSRAWGFTHPNVWPGFAVVIGYIVGLFILNVILSLKLKV